MIFHSPYNFIPLQAPVLLDGVHAALSSGIPLRDGLCGSLAIEMEVLTPLLVGGARTTINNAIHVRPFQFPDGRYGVPGSSLHGMLRSIVEAVMGGRMRQLDDRRFALRDFVSTVKADYADKMKDVKAGFLRRGLDGQREIIPCDYVLFDHKALEPFGINPASFGRKESILNRSSLGHKYDLLEPAFPQWKVEASEFVRDKNGRMISRKLRPGGSGRFVVSAQINDGTVRNSNGKGNGKHHDFIFYNRKEASAIPVTSEQWRDFLFTHDDEKVGSIRPWPGYWRERHERGHEVPVFYLRDESGLRFGLARMFRLAGRTSTHDALRLSHPELLDAEGFDLSDALFGTLGDAGVGAARGRVSCAPFVAPPLAPVPLGRTVLASPKPSYYPAYLYQSKDWTKKWTHWDSSKEDKPMLRGHKRYYAKGSAQLAAPPDNSRESVQTQLFALPAGTVLTGRIVIHNLAPFELGALLWALDFGAHSSACHQLGMGKPFGMGRVRLRLQKNNCRLRANTPGDALPLEAWLDEARSAFRTFIDARIPDWANSLPVRALLALSDPAASTPAGLDPSRYPSLGPRNEFDKTVQGPGPLPYAVSGDAIPALSLRLLKADKEKKLTLAELQYGAVRASDQMKAECMLFFKKNEGKLFAVIDKRDHPLPKALSDEVLAKLSNKAKEKAADRKLLATVRYTVLGNSYTVLECELKQ